MFRTHTTVGKVIDEEKERIITKVKGKFIGLRKVTILIIISYAERDD